MKKYVNLIMTTFFIILEVFLLSKTKIIIFNFKKTLNNCLYNLMPTMFFSILFSQILIKLNFFKYISKHVKNILKLLFKTDDQDIIIFILSMISGYPNNSKMAINSNNLNNIMQYTNFVNPIFLIGTVGGIYLKNIKLSIIILLSHYISNIILGIILRKNNLKYNKIINSNNNSVLNIYYSSLKDTIFTLSIIFSNILFFSIISSLISCILNIKGPIGSCIIGLIEFSSGIYNIANTNINLHIKGLIITSIISFGSFSIHMQIMNINPKIKYIKYLFYRIINVFISVILYFIIYNILI